MRSYQGEEDMESTKESTGEYFCTQCGASLNEQKGFDPSRGTWRCAVCGSPLFDDNVPDGERFPGILWFCDGCGALLNGQKGFTDIHDTWQCLVCGFVNDISEENIEE